MTLSGWKTYIWSFGLLIAGLCLVSFSDQPAFQSAGTQLIGMSGLGAFLRTAIAANKQAIGQIESKLP